ISIRPNFSSAWENMGTAYFDLGQFNESIAAYQNETKYDPDNAVAWYYLGTIYEKTNDIPSAVDSYEKAIKIEPNLTMVNDRLEAAKRNMSSSYSPSATLVAKDNNSGTSSLLSGIFGLVKP
ncbi:MAG: tetratricopeptide repeat protein, partial [Methanospirillum sp.]|nr:tetratricopeptide repeat protein [Methanospirillum sp.]